MLNAFRLSLGDGLTKITERCIFVYICKPYMDLVVRTPAFCISKNKDDDQLRGNR